MAILNMVGGAKTEPIEIKDWLCFTANTAGSTVQLTKTGSPTSITLETSIDGNIWTTYTFGDTITLSNIGDKVYFRNSSEATTGFSTSSSNYYQFVMTGSIAGSGDVNFLINKNSTKTIIGEYCYLYLFKGCTSLTTAPKLPATTLAQHCYQSMFQSCSGLKIAPELPATTLAFQCYTGMFNGCTGLKIAPELPATTLADYCYYMMFQSCTGLKIVPELPATTLNTYCYANMFIYCTGLVSLPRLSATTLANTCYGAMFYGCTNIKISSSQTGVYQTAYRIPTTGTGTNNNSLTNMFKDTGGTFTGTPTINTTYYTSNIII